MEGFAEALSDYEALLMRFGREGQNRALAREVGDARRALFALVQRMLAAQFESGVETGSGR